MMRRKIIVGALCSIAVVAWSGSVFAQQASSSLTMEDLQKQIQQLLGQMQVFQQQIVSLKKELGVQQTAPAASTSRLPVESASEPNPAGDSIAQEGDVVMAPDITRTLLRGSRGEDVRRLQEFLVKDPSAAYVDGSVTGYFGPGTEAALKRWQAKNGLAPVGIVGRKTVAKFKEINDSVSKNFSQQQDQPADVQDQANVQGQTKQSDKDKTKSESLVPTAATTSQTTTQMASGTNSSMTTMSATAPAGQKEQIWNSLGLRSWIRTDADSTQIESLKRACTNVPPGANVWPFNSGNSASTDFGMPSAEECRLATACTSSQYFDGTSCMSKGSGNTGYYTGGGGGGGGTASSCDSALTVLLGSGCHQMYGDSSGNPIFCDGPMTKSAKRGDTAAATGCSGPSSGTTNTGTTTIPAGQKEQIWNSLGLRSWIRTDADSARIESLKQSCTTVSNGVGSIWLPDAGNSASTDFGMPSAEKCRLASACTSTQYFNGTSCVSSTSGSSSCASGQYWNGSSCVANTTTSCTSGQYWNGSACVANSSATGSTGGCSQYGSGWHTMSSDGTCYDPQMTNYRTANGTLYACSTTPASGCSSSWSSGSGSCASGQYWNGSSCVANTTTSCTSGQYWNGSACVSSTPSTSCSSGQYWNGSACVANPTPTPSSTSCTSGQYWNGSACTATTTSDCTSGQYWNGSACVANPTPTPTPSSTSCPSGQYWNGSACAASVSGASIVSALDLAQLQTLLQSLSSSLRSLGGSSRR